MAAKKANSNHETENASDYQVSVQFILSIRFINKQTHSSLFKRLSNEQCIIVGSILFGMTVKTSASSNLQTNCTDAC